MIRDLGFGSCSVVFYLCFGTGKYVLVIDEAGSMTTLRLVMFLNAIFFTGCILVTLSVRFQKMSWWRKGPTLTLVFLFHALCKPVLPLTTFLVSCTTFSAWNQSVGCLNDVVVGGPGWFVQKKLTVREAGDAVDLALKDLVIRYPEIIGARRAKLFTDVNLHKEKIVEIFISKGPREAEAELYTVFGRVVNKSIWQAYAARPVFSANRHDALEQCEVLRLFVTENVTDNLVLVFILNTFLLVTAICLRSWNNGSK